MLLPLPSGDPDEAAIADGGVDVEDGLAFDRSRELRMQAEKILSHNSPDVPENVDALSPGEVRRLLHDLRVYQIELEIQNEELRRAQLELEASRAQYFELYNLAPIGYVTLDQRGMIQKANLTASQLLGLERDLLMRQPITRFIAREHQDIYYLQRRDLLGTGGQRSFDLRMVGSCDTWFWAHVEMAVDSAGEAPLYRIVIVDITDRKQAEEMLNKAHLQLEEKVRERTLELEKTNSDLQIQIRERSKVAQELGRSREHYRNMVELLPIAIFSHTEGGIRSANTAAVELMEVATQQDLVGRHLVEFLTSSDDQKMFTQQLQEVLFKRACKSLTMRFVSTSGAAIDVELLLTAFTDQGDPTAQITAYNLTERKKIEEELAKADKLESISILAGGIAHDFNNYLATVLGNITLANVQADNPEQVRRYLQNMEKATHRVKLLSSQLFAFARGGAPLKKTVSLSKLVRSSVEFAVAGSSVRCLFSLPEDLHLVEIDQDQMTQVIYNIVINAMQASPEGGTVRVEGENVTVGDQDQHIPLPLGKYAKISIKDEGPGIPEKYLPRIFDPFFSTKQRGSGLGLATSYSIIKNHGGFIQAESQEGKGTTFSIFLPASTKTSLPDIQENEIIHGTGKVLVVDDEADIREVMGGMLSSLGYETDFAKDGAEAVTVYRKAQEAGHPFDLVVMDLTIPGGMGGKEAVRTLLKVDPDVRAVVSSGYSDEPVMANYMAYGFRGVIRKPYTIAEVSRVVHGVRRTEVRALHKLE